jgi:hypothetical protein
MTIVPWHSNNLLGRPLFSCIPWLLICLPNTAGLALGGGTGWDAVLGSLPPMVKDAGGGTGCGDGPL